jgi:D-3-phosphoglycerate dehydrogenase
MLDEISSNLAATGINVLRALRPGGGAVKLDFKEEVESGFFRNCDAMLFGSRSYCTRDVLLSAPRVRAVMTPTVGLETVDVNAATELNIAVGHGPVPENHMSMAEANVMLILNLFYQLKKSQEVLEGTRPRPPQIPKFIFSQMLRGRTIGMIGFGRIARATALRLDGFGVRIVIHTRSKPPELPNNAELVTFESLIEQSDIVCVFATATAQNQGLISRSVLKRMKKSAYLLNTARGSLVDEGALYAALKDGDIAGAALDTFATEPLPKESPLRELDNVILTPHMVGHTREVIQATISTAVENVTRVLRGELPMYCKNPSVESKWKSRLADIERMATA